MKIQHFIVSQRLKYNVYLESFLYEYKVMQFVLLVVYNLIPVTDKKVLQLSVWVLVLDF